MVTGSVEMTGLLGCAVCPGAEHRLPGPVSILRSWHCCTVVRHHSALTFQRIEAVDEDQVVAVGLADRAVEAAA